MYDDITEQQSQLINKLVEAFETNFYETEFIALGTLAGWKITLSGKNGGDDKEIDNFSETDLIALSEEGYFTFTTPNQYSHRASLKPKAFEQYRLQKHSKKTKPAIFSLLRTFGVAFISSYFVIVSGIWGFIEAYTYFQGDKLKEMLGPFWISLYLSPLLISFIVGVIRLNVIHNHSQDRLSAQTTKPKPRTQSSTEKSKKFIYKGLLWKMARFNFQYPVPLCPLNNCERPVYFERIHPPRYLISADKREMQDFLNKQHTYKNVYRCPIHGELSGVPDTDLEDLKREARFEQNRK